MILKPETPAHHSHLHPMNPSSRDPTNSLRDLRSILPTRISSKSTLAARAKYTPGRNFHRRRQCTIRRRRSQAEACVTMGISATGWML
jgi:hypothetical protein